MSEWRAMKFARGVLVRGIHAEWEVFLKVYLRSQDRRRKMVKRIYARNANSEKRRKGSNDDRIR